MKNKETSDSGLGGGIGCLFICIGIVIVLNSSRILDLLEKIFVK